MLVGLLGHHIGYSASPAMQNAGFRAAGLTEWTFELFDVAPEELPQAVSALRLAGRAGANVTIPHKLAVMPLLDELEPLAAEAGAVNLIRRDGERLVGGNTDIAGVEVALKEVGWNGGRALILGRGGSAKAAAVALRGSEVEMVGRDRWDQRGELSRAADLVVNCTPLGRDGESVIRPADLPRRAVIDLVYVRGGTPLVAAARAAGLPASDGWTILLAQGAASFNAWTGLAAPVEAMREALAR
ncbi:MAG TPA: shikimate dehydrogenase [Candidatus Dormibacteraeota bacterium]|nr:shikimate dehydrogenase [Candidatus Dormibacteraeota bacterium]